MNAGANLDEVDFEQADVVDTCCGARLLQDHAVGELIEGKHLPLNLLQGGQDHGQLMPTK